MTEIKNTLEGISSKLDNTEEQISKFEDKVVEINQAEQNKKIATKNYMTIKWTTQKKWINFQKCTIFQDGIWKKYKI